MSFPCSQESRYLRLLEAAEILHAHDMGRFQDRVLQACQLLFPETCNSFELWSRKDGTHEGAMNVPYDPKEIDERFRLIGELAPTQNPCFPHLIAGTTSPLRMSDFTTLRELRRTEFFEVVFKPVELRFQAAIPLQTETHVGAITFNKGGRKDFTTEDLHFVQLLARHVALAHRISVVFETAAPLQPVVASNDNLALLRAGLTTRECEVMRWMEQGKTDKEIAIILGISHRTVGDHVRSILNKLGVENRTAAVVAVQHQ